MALTMAISQQPRTFGSPQERLDYLIEMLCEMRRLSAPDYPSVGDHLQAAIDEAQRLVRLRD